MKRRKWVIAVSTVLIVTACGALLVLRFGGLRGQDLATRVGAREVHQPAAGEAFKAVEDWPRWRGPREDGISRESAGTSWPAGGLKKLWAADVGIGYSSPIAVAGKVYLFSLNNGKDNLSCFDADTGNLAWAVDSDVGWTETYEGSRATPTVVGDAIYTFGGTGELACRDLAGGKLRWKQDVFAAAGGKPNRWGAASTPLVEDGLVFVQAGEGGPVAVAFKADAGAVAWRSEATGGAGYAHPILIEVKGTKQLVVFAAAAVYGMDPTSGKTVWREEWGSNYGVAATTPVYRDGKLYVSTGYGKGGLMLDVTPTGATRAWAKPDIDSKFQGLILDGDALYGNAEASGSGRLVCIGWPDGARRWRAEDSKLKLGLGGSLVRAAGDRMVLLGEDGMLSLAKVTPAGAELVSQFRAVGREIKVWSTPLLYGGRLYVKGPKELVCFELPKE